MSAGMFLKCSQIDLVLDAYPLVVFFCERGLPPLLKFYHKILEVTKTYEKNPCKTFNDFTRKDALSQFAMKTQKILKKLISIDENIQPDSWNAV